MSKSVIVLEFNELTPRLVNQFIAEGSLPNFKRLRDESFVAVTDAEEQPPALNPWVQWVTVHTGKSFAEHGVFHLADGPKYRGRRVWDIVSDAGKPVWVCGSMNSGIRNERINGAVLPDPWASELKPYPPALNDFHDLTSRFVRDHNSNKPAVTKSAFIRFARFMATSGLSFATIRAALAQLATERKNRTQWSRAFILDRLQRDMFKHYYKKLQPALATLFANSTAHFQHFYWRNFEPHSFKLQPSEFDQRRFANAIREGYVRMDEAIGEIFELAGPETSIVLCTALSQQPLTKYDLDGGKQLFKPIDHAKLTAFAGIDSAYAFEPVMSEKFNLKFETDEAGERAVEKLAKLRMDDGRPLLGLDQSKGRKVVVVCRINQFPADGALIASAEHNATVRFDELFLPIEGVKSGMHHPDGILWIRTPERRHVAIRRKVSLREIAPTLLYLSDTPIPEGEYALPVIPELVETAQALRSAA